MNKYLSILRPHHWSKNSITLVGVILALLIFNQAITVNLILETALLLVVLGLISSANYILNDLLDKEKDLKHPLKRLRPITSGEISNEKSTLIMLLFYLFSFVISYFAFNDIINIALGVFIIQAITYNVPPVRLKDIAFLDVISESLNSPIRFFIGWTLISSSLPPLSMLVFWFTYTAVLMQSKRLAEFRFLGRDKAREYRDIFNHYSENGLKYSVIIYIGLAVLSFAYMAYLFNNLYQIISLLLLIQLIWYYSLANKGKPEVQKPAYIYKNILFTIYSIFIVSLFTLISLVII